MKKKTIRAWVVVDCDGDPLPSTLTLDHSEAKTEVSRLNCLHTITEMSRNLGRPYYTLVPLGHHTPATRAGKKGKR